MTSGEATGHPTRRFSTCQATPSNTRGHTQRARKRYIDALDLLLFGQRGWSDWEELRGDVYGASVERVKGLA